MSNTNKTILFKFKIKFLLKKQGIVIGSLLTRDYFF